jgi:PhnB protein
MARVSTYLNFSRNTEEAFNFYRSVFGGEFGGRGIKDCLMHYQSAVK